VKEAVMDQLVPNKVVQTIIEIATPYVKDGIDKLTGEEESRRAKKEEEERSKLNKKQ
jgi:hypothetical protein